MGTARFEGDRLLVNGHSLFLRGGEIHYFRLPVDAWRDRMEQARQCGLNTISSYMPWYWHEPVEGQVDLTGATRPERNLRHFLDLAAELGLYVIARPGPFVNSELRYGGFPEWLFRDHPETMSRRADGNIAPGRPLPAEGEPAYRRYVRQWYRNIVPVIAEYDIHNGGPVILFQPDNELSAAWSFGLLNSLYDPTILGNTWPRWLAETYGGVDEVSARHERAYADFQGVSPPRAFPATPGEKRLCQDWLNFKRWFFADWGATLAQWAIEDGIRVPMIFNEPVAGFYNHGDHAGFGKELQSRGIQGTTSCHTYADRILDLSGSMSAALGIELVKSSPWDGPPMAVEVNAGWYIPRLSRSAVNWEPMLRLGFGHGLMGQVIYPFAAADMSFDDTIDGPDYWDDTCVNCQGRPIRAYNALQRYYRFISAWEGEIACARMVSEVSIAYTPGARLLDFLGVPSLLDQDTGASQGPGGESFTAEPTLDRGAKTAGHDWLDGYEGVSKQTVPAEAGIWKRVEEAALLCARANLGFDLRNLTAPNREPGNGLLIVPCTGSLESTAIEYLLEHLRQSGRCLFFPALPVYNTDGHPDTRLIDLLNVKLTDQIRPAGGEVMDYGVRVVDFGPSRQVGTVGWIYLHEFPMEAETLATFEGRPVIASLRDGQAIIAGMDMSFTSRPSLEFWQMVLRYLGVEPAVTVQGSFCRAMLRRGSDASILTVMDMTGNEEASRLELRQPVEGIASISFNVQLAPHEARCLLIGAQLGDHRLLYTTSEVIPTDDGGYQLHGRIGTPGCLAFDRPTAGILDTVQVKTRDMGDAHVIEYEHQQPPLVFRLAKKP